MVTYPNYQKIHELRELTDDLADEQVMILVQKGKLNYMELLFQRYKKPLYNYFLKSTLDTDESNDLTQITFVRVMKYRGSFNADRGFKVWLFQIARNLIKDHYRKMKVYRDQFSMIENIPEYAEEDVTNEQLDRERKLHQALAKLPDEKREILVMSKFQGLKYEEIAKIREMSVSAIKVQVHRTMGQLRKLYFEQTD